MRNKPARLILFSLFALILILPNLATPAQAQADGPSPRYGASLVNVDGRIFLFAGKINPEMNELWQFDGETNEFQQLAPPDPKPAPRYGHAAASAGGKMYIFGGKSGDEFLSDVWVYDPAANTWTELHPMGEKLKINPGAKAVENGEAIYVVDENGVNFYLTTDSLWLYLAPLPAQLGEFGVGSINGHPLVFGGWDYTTNAENQNAYLFNPGTKQWQTLTCAGDPLPALELSAVVSQGNTVWVIGGNQGPTISNDILQIGVNAALNQCEVKTVDSNPEYGRTNAAAAVLPGSTESEPRILLFGGDKGGTIVADPFIIDLGGLVVPAPTPTKTPEPPIEPLPVPINPEDINNPKFCLGSALPPMILALLYALSRRR